MMHRYSDPDWYVSPARYGHSPQIKEEAAAALPEDSLYFSLFPRIAPAFPSANAPGLGAAASSVLHPLALEPTVVEPPEVLHLSKRAVIGTEGDVSGVPAPG